MKKYSLDKSKIKILLLEGIHENVPGVLREVNSFFSSKGINISAEYLQTDPDIGYVIIETESELDASVLKDLKNIPYTIRARILY